MNKEIDGTDNNSGYYLFFDTETTGLPKNFDAPITDSDNWPRLIQIAWILSDVEGGIINEKKYIIKPDAFSIPSEAIAINGITNEFALTYGSELNTVLFDFISDLNRCKYIVAHNIDFDSKVISSEFDRNHIKDLIATKNKICTMQQSVDYCKLPSKNGYKYPKLSELHIKLFGTDFENAHDALVDVSITKKCFFEMKKKGLIKEFENLIRDYNRIKQLFIGYPDFFTTRISQEYPLSILLIDKYKDKWNWSDLSMNESLPWSADLIGKYDDKWDWWRLSLNEGLPWSGELIERYKNKWDWCRLFGNNKLTWTDELIEKYHPQKRYVSVLSSNKKLQWTDELIEKYKYEWYWYNWPMITPYHDNLIKHAYSPGLAHLSRNETLPWTDEFIEKYKDKWCWGNLSLNEGVKWSGELIERYKDKWNWSDLSMNESLPWSADLIGKYDDKWDWWSLSLNEGVKWSGELIERYKDKWDWSHLSSNKSLPWSVDLIKKYEDKWDWDKLYSNDYLPWSIDFIYRYIDRWDWNTSVCQESGESSMPIFWEKAFSRIVNNQMIEEVFSEVIESSDIKEITFNEKEQHEEASVNSKGLIKRVQ
jgi:DNA polymerase III epsilon subunit-like protein